MSKPVVCTSSSVPIGLEAESINLSRQQLSRLEQLQSTHLFPMSLVPFGTEGKATLAKHAWLYDIIIMIVILKLASLIRAAII